MEIFEVRHVINPDYNGYKEEHFCFIKAENEDAAYKKLNITSRGYYPITKIGKKEKKRIKEEAKSIKKEIKKLKKIFKSYKGL